jgi:PAS domain S-box-containing protein
VSSPESDQLLRLLVDRVEDYAIFVLDPHGHVASWNPGAARIKGYRPEEIIGSHFSRFYRRDEVEAGKCEMELVEAARLGRFEDEGWRVRKDGSEFWANVVITALRDETGRLVGYAKVTRDLTARRQSEEDARRLAEARASQRASETLLRVGTAFASALTRDDVASVIATEVLPALAADGGSLAIRRPQTDELVLQWSLGYRPEQVREYQTVGITEALPRAEAARTRAPVFLDSREEISARYPRLATGYLEVHAHAALPLVAGGGAIGVLGLSRSLPLPFDPTDRTLILAVANQCALALARALAFERELEAKRGANFLAQASVSLSSTLDVDSIAKTLAELAVPMLGDWCAVELLDEGALREVALVHADACKVGLARELRRRYPPDPSVAAEVIRTGVPVVHSVVTDEDLAAAAQDAAHLEALRAFGLRSALVLPLGSGGASVGVLTVAWSETDRHYSADDVNTVALLCGRASLAIENARLYDEVRHAVRVRDDFMSIAGHELRTPLAAMLLSLQSLDRLLGKPDDPPSLEALRDRVAKAERNGRRLERLISELLDVARIRSGRLTLEPEELDLAELVRTTVSGFSDLAARHGCELHIDVGEPLHGRWDRFRLEQVVGNLVTNALKYGRCRPVRVSLVEADGAAVLEVEDSGIGIDASHHGRIFERFERAVTAPHFGGLGLGLWICRQIVDASGGTIEVQSEPEVGSRFRVVLPRRSE